MALNIDWTALQKKDYSKVSVNIQQFIGCFFNQYLFAVLIEQDGFLSQCQTEVFILTDNTERREERIAMEKIE